MDLPDNAFILLAIHEFGGPAEGKGDLASLFEHCQVIVKAARKSDAIERDSEGRVDLIALATFIPFMAKMLQEVEPPRVKKTPSRKRQPPKLVITPDEGNLDQETALLRVLKDRMAVSAIVKEFQKRGWGMDIKRMDGPILATLRTSDLFECVNPRPEKFSLSSKGKDRVADGAREVPEPCVVDPLTDSLDDDDDFQGILDGVDEPSEPHPSPQAGGQEQLTSD